MSTTDWRCDSEDVSLRRYLHQPIDVTAHLLFLHQLCEIESLTASDPVLKSSLSNSRMQLAMAYLNEQHLETLIEQLEQVRLVEIGLSNYSWIYLDLCSGVREFEMACTSNRH